MNEATTEYIASLMTLLVGKPEHIVVDLPHPELGVLGRCKFLPTVADVREWMAPRLEHEAVKLRLEKTEQAQIEDRREEPSEAERERVLQAYRRGKQALIDKSDEWRNAIGGKAPRPSQKQHSMEELCSTDLMKSGKIRAVIAEQIRALNEEKEC